MAGGADPAGALGSVKLAGPAIGDVARVALAVEVVFVVAYGALVVRARRAGFAVDDLAAGGFGRCGGLLRFGAEMG